MDAIPKRRGGPGRGQGKKPEGEEATEVVSIRLQPKQKAKLLRLGGGKWVRKKLDEAPEPSEK